MAKIQVEVRCKSGKVCPLCRIACLQSWETVCSRCWEYLGNVDRMTGSTYQQQIRDNKKVVIYLPPIIHKIMGVFYPLSKEDRMKRVKRLTKRYCHPCQKDVSHDCQNCWVHWLSNEILGNGD